MKKLISFLLIAVLLVGVSVSANQVDVGITHIGLLVEDPNYASQSWYQMLFEGFTVLESRYNLSINIYAPDGEPNFNELVETAASQNSIVVSASFLFSEAIGELAQDYPDVRFIVIDSIPMNHALCDEEHLNCTIPENVHAYTFKEHEGSFLAGIAAGLTTKTNNAGFVGGMDLDFIKRFEVGYTAGVLTANTKSRVVTNYADAFDDLYRGFYYAAKQYKLEDVDVIYHAAGLSGDGVIEAADVFKFWAIGVDADQSYLAPDHVLCSMRKRLDRALILGIESVMNNTFADGHTLLGLAEGGLDISDFSGNLKLTTQKKILYYIEKIISSEIVVPSTVEELEAYLGGI